MALGVLHVGWNISLDIESRFAYVLTVGWNISLDIESRFANVLTVGRNRVLLMSLFANVLVCAGLLNIRLR